MTRSDSTCWTVIQGAAAGRAQDREDFARHYAPVVLAYLNARWLNSSFRDDIDDASQEVFVECFRQGGVLEKADRDRIGGFRAFLYGVVRNVALRYESRNAVKRKVRSAGDLDLDGVERDEETLSQLFDRAWARSLLQEAAELQEKLARTAGEAALKRVELLQLRFHEQLPIREIARRWGTDAASLHREYARARKEFRKALFTVASFHHSGSDVEIEHQCARILDFFR